MNKKIYFIYLFTFSISLSLFAQNIPNGNFENWTTTTGYTTNYATPVSWENSNEVTLAPPTNSALVTQSDEFQDGASSVKIETKQVGPNPTPGCIALGNYVFKIPGFYVDSMKSGVDYAYRPYKFKGYYKFAPVGSDVMKVSISLTKWNGTTRDVIGTGYFKNSIATSTWALIDLPINYISTDTPDTLRIIATCLNAGATVGTIVQVDNFSFEMSNSINENSNINSINLYPNPVNNSFQIDFNNYQGNNVNVNIYNLAGQLFLSKNISVNQNKAILSLTGVVSGNYIIEIKNSNELLYRDKIIIQH